MFQPLTPGVSFTRAMQMPRLDSQAKSDTNNQLCSQQQEIYNLWQYNILRQRWHWSIVKSRFYHPLLWTAFEAAWVASIFGMIRSSFVRHVHMLLCNRLHTWLHCKWLTCPSHCTCGYCASIVQNSPSWLSNALLLATVQHEHKLVLSLWHGIVLHDRVPVLPITLLLPIIIWPYVPKCSTLLGTW
jgi:hypothetical protein